MEGVGVSYLNSPCSIPGVVAIALLSAKGLSSSSSSLSSSVVYRGLCCDAEGAGFVVAEGLGGIAGGGFSSMLRPARSGGGLVGDEGLELPRSWATRYAISKEGQRV